MWLFILRSPSCQLWPLWRFSSDLSLLTGYNVCWKTCQCIGQDNGLGAWVEFPVFPAFDNNYDIISHFKHSFWVESGGLKHSTVAHMQGHCFTARRPWVGVGKSTVCEWVCSLQLTDDLSRVCSCLLPSACWDRLLKLPWPWPENKWVGPWMDGYINK